MLAACATSINREDPLAALTVGEFERPAPPQGWVGVNVKAAALNHHDLWSLRGIALSAEQVPMVLGTDASGTTDDGREVIVHAVIGDPDAGGGDETLDPKRSLLSEIHHGTLAERVYVPARNLVDKPAWLSFEDAAALPTAWLTAYRMLFTKAQVRPGQSVLVQGAGGGVATALISLAHAAGVTVFATSRDEAKRAHALTLGADGVFESGGRLPQRVDAVMETVGRATWDHSLKSLRPGGRLVVSGATSGFDPSEDLRRVYFLQLSIIGSTMGRRQELADLVAFLGVTGLRPTIDRTLPLADAAAGLAAMNEGTLTGKVVLQP
jgi:NADPH:quinone reductase-like Zn-dependent oxidoreductase